MEPPTVAETDQQKLATLQGDARGHGIVDHYSSHAKEVLDKYGDEPIATATLVRKPLDSAITTVLNILSFGDFLKRVEQSPYDKLFHLRIDFELKSGIRVSAEKLDIVTLSVNQEYLPKSEQKVINFVPPDLTLQLIMNNTQRRMGSKFFPYNALHNNCQDFVMAILKSNNLGDQNDYDFVKQDVKSIFKNYNFLRKFTNTVTDFAATIHMLTDNGFLRMIGGGDLEHEDGLLVWDMDNNVMVLPKEKKELIDDFIKEMIPILIECPYQSLPEVFNRILRNTDTRWSSVSDDNESDDGSAYGSEEINELIATLDEDDEPTPGSLIAFETTAPKFKKFTPVIKFNRFRK